MKIFRLYSKMIFAMTYLMHSGIENSMWIYIEFAHKLVHPQHLRGIWKTCAVLKEWCTLDCSRILLECRALVGMPDNGLDQGALASEALWVIWLVKHENIDKEIKVLFYSFIINVGAYTRFEFIVITFLVETQINV